MTLLLIVLLFFVAILLGLATLYAGYSAISASPSLELKKRLRNLAVQSDEAIPVDLRIEILDDMTPAERYIYRFSLVRRLEKLIDTAGLKMDVKMFMIFMLIVAVAFFFVGMLLKRGVIPAVILFIIGGLAPLFYLKARKNKRSVKFTEQFPDALDMMSRSLRSGHAISLAIKMVGTETSEPLAGIFKTAYDEQMLGLSMRDALMHMLERMPGMDLQLFVTAVDIHREIGGNLAETLERLASTIRERLKIRRQVKVYTAQGRLSGMVLVVLPIVMALFFYIASPGYLEELFNSSLGRNALIVAAIGQVIGFLVIRRIINIKI